jgi:hypothetical protein
MRHRLETRTCAQTEAGKSCVSADRASAFIARALLVVALPRELRHAVPILAHLLHENDVVAPHLPVGRTLAVGR